LRLVDAVDDLRIDVRIKRSRWITARCGTIAVERQ
jgi:hypothetical protein